MEDGRPVYPVWYYTFMLNVHLSATPVPLRAIESEIPANYLSLDKIQYCDSNEVGRSHDC